MTHAEALPVAAPGLTAVLFGLSGCLVDFGARAHQHASVLPEHADATPLLQLPGQRLGPIQC